MRIRSTLLVLTLLGLACAAPPFAEQDGAVAKGESLSEASIVPPVGYEWPENGRDYWPTTSWQSAPPERHGLDPNKLAIANDTAEKDPFFRSLLVVRNGFMVFENYYHGGAIDQKTEVWSVTKSFTSALIGIAIDKGHISGSDELMAHLLPKYPDFRKMTIENVLTHETGLAWDEGSQESWILSSDWVAEALSRGYVAEPGQALLYSSANSHFLSALIKETTGASPGVFARQNLFEPLGIEFVPPTRERRYTSWQELHEPSQGTWRQDNGGLEIGAFGLRLTGREMAKFGFLYLNRGVWDGKTIVSTAWVEDSTRDHVLRSGTVGFGYHWMVVKRAGHIAFDADGWGGQSISVIPALDMVIVTKCDAVNPQGRSSYRVLEQVLEAVVE
jgi:CubicO group peptidase (beta-lactamase class C family)